MSTVKVNTVTKRSGSTLTLGESGTTVTLASGASQSGFGRTGAVDWQTGSIKTATFDTANGEGYFCNTQAGAFSATLPSSPSAGDIVAIKDYKGTFQNNNLTVARNGSPIDGQSQDLVLNELSQSVTLVYVDATQGWMVTADSTITNHPLFVNATGGTTTTSGNFRIHTFTGPGTFCVSCAGNAAGSNSVSYMVVAGGGGGGFYAGGAGAGGYREGKAATDCYTASPLNAPAGLPLSIQAYPITVGGGGPGGNSSTDPGTKGSDSVFSTITSTGGGFSAGGPTSGAAGGPGGSGGAGAPANPSGSGTPGTGNTPPVSPPQGNSGGTSHHQPGVYQLGGGGGGAGAAGANVNPTGSCATAAAAGGAGVTSCITASPVTRAGGGGGGSDNPRPAGAGGSGGGGAGGHNPSPQTEGFAGTANTGGGGGGGGGSSCACGGAGGSGVVVIRYKFQ